MNTPMAAIALSVDKPGSYKKRRVLLVDTAAHKRDLRAEVMRKLGMEVDCAADIPEARIWWRADLYDLVLINAEKGRGHRDRFCDDLRGATPPQRLAFLVGEPAYLASEPAGDEQFLVQNAAQRAVISDAKAALSGDPNSNQRWGILEASRRISAVRSACTARTQAMRDLPPPSRDEDARPSKHITPRTTLDDLLREEMQ
jgi:CheY-like chemotaxis protein